MAGSIVVGRGLQNGALPSPAVQNLTPPGSGFLWDNFVNLWV